jgi:hypothetical protein
MSKRTRAVIQGALILAILFFWGLAIARNWEQFVTYPWTLSAGMLFLAFLAAVGEIVMAFLVWWRALALTGARIPWMLGMQLFFRAQIARYLPGGVWDLVGRFVLGSQAGVGKRAMAASMGLEMGLQVLSGSLFLLAALALRTDLDIRLYLGVGLVVVAGSLLFLAPPVFTFFVNTLLGLLKKPRLDMALTFAGLFQLFLLRLGGHLLMGLGFAFFVRGIAPVPASQTLLLITAFVGAWLIGYVAIIFPMGVGVREGALVLLTSGFLPFGVATAGVVGYRVLVAVRDLLAAGVGVGLSKRSQDAPPPPG